MDRTREAAGIGVAGLDRLTEAEREALHLLAEGHTAKSIAALTGRSVAAVNERLRDARRKTGASSSRELARLLKAEKAGDEKIGIAAPAVAGAGPIPGSAPNAATPMRKGMMMGTILAVTAAAAAALYVAHGSAPGASVPLAKGDPLLEKMFEGPDHEPRRLYMQVRHERRDETWASHAEAALKAYYRELPHSGSIRNLRILCASTLCEVAGGISQGTPAETNAVMSDLQDQKLIQPLRQVGLKWATASFGSSTGSTAFAIYWLRDRS